MGTSLIRYLIRKKVSIDIVNKRQRTIRRNYELSPRGYYLPGFTTTIHDVTPLEYSKRYQYGIQLVSHFHKDLEKLYSLHLKTYDDTITMHKEVHLVKMGQIVKGRLFITVQQVNDTMTIYYIYQYRAKSQEFSKLTYKHTNKVNLNESHLQRYRRERQYRHSIAHNKKY